MPTGITKNTATIADKVANGTFHRDSYIQSTYGGLTKHSLSPIFQHEIACCLYWLLNDKQ